MRLIKIIFFVGLLLGFVNSASAQRPRAPRNVSASERVDMQLLRLKDKLDLTSDQMQKMHAPLLKIEQEKIEIMKSENPDISRRMELSKEADNAIEALLTKEQKASYDAIKEERRAKAREVRSNN